MHSLLLQFLAVGWALSYRKPPVLRSPGFGEPRCLLSLPKVILQILCGAWIILVSQSFRAFNRGLRCKGVICRGGSFNEASPRIGEVTSPSVIPCPA